jgi:putative ABC transport system permease protein
VTPAPRPPRVSAWLLARTVRDEAWRDDLVGDLHEEFATRTARDGRARAGRWFRRETASLMRQATAARLRRVAPALATLLFIGDRPMSEFFNELRHAGRALTRRPGISIAIVLTLAVGLGVNAAIFNAVDNLLLTPFRFPDVKRLVAFSEISDDAPYPKESVAPANYLDLVRNTQVFDRTAAYEWGEANLSGGERPERVAAYGVTGGFFETLGVRPLLGRLIDANDARAGQPKVAVLSDVTWRERFGADPGVVGRTVRIDGQPALIVGVAQPDFHFPDGAQVWTALTWTAEQAASRTDRGLTAFGRLAPGRTEADARAALTAVYARLAEAHPDDFRGGLRLLVQSFSKTMIDVGMPTVLALWQAAALFVLLIACTNVVNLLVAQGAERQRELAVRMALGAGRARIARQLLIESVVLSAASVPAALGVAWVALAGLRAAMPAALIRYVPGWDRLSISWPLFGWTALAACVVGLVFGLLPAWQAGRGQAAGALNRDSGRSGTANRSRQRARRALVVAEIALALPLLVTSALSAMSVRTFVTGDQGYAPDGVVRASIVLPDPAYEKDDAMRQFSERLLDEVRRLPGVTAVGAASVLPASGNNRTRTFEIEGRPVDRDRPVSANFRIVTPGYFDALRIPVTSGRDFTSGDRADSQRVVVVSQSFAARHWPNASPIGARIKLPAAGPDWLTIVGVAGDVIDDWFANRNVPTMYVAVAQYPTHYVNLAIRTAAGAGAVEPALRSAVAAVDDQLPLFQVRTMREALKERTTGLRFIGALMAAFGVIALGLSAIGIYSVMAFYVTTRRKEFGVRLALGATPQNVLTLTLRHATWLSAFGIAIGLAVAVALAKLMAQAMFGTVSPNPALFAIVAAALFLVATIASLLPARAATRVDPATTLRD